jgi:uncharacterized protein
MSDDDRANVEPEATRVANVVVTEGARLPKRRVGGIDLARSLAFLGMVFVNFRTTLVPSSEAGDRGWLTWLDSRLDGRAAATFVTLAGVGVSLMSSRARATGDPKELGRVRGVLVRRAAFLFAVGLLYWPIWPADILHVYGVFLAVGALLLTAPDRWLLTIAAALVVGFVILLVSLQPISAIGPGRGGSWPVLR